jgi:flavin reductase (DIM6/NTAB) family NADH-FMN oxidoreductase RutF
MAETNRGEVSPIGAALGRLPSGIYILTAREGDRATGMLASWVQQAGFQPPMVTVAVRSDRFVAEWIAQSGRFTLNQVAAGHKPLLKHFARGFGPDEDAFAGLEVVQDAQGGPVLGESLAWLDARVAGQVEGGDHRVFLAEVVGGGLLDREGEPMTHVRRNGFHD